MRCLATTVCSTSSATTLRQAQGRPGLDEHRGGFLRQLGERAALSGLRGDSLRLGHDTDRILLLRGRTYRIPGQAAFLDKGDLYR